MKTLEYLTVVMQVRIKDRKDTFFTGNKTLKKSVSYALQNCHRLFLEL